MPEISTQGNVDFFLLPFHNLSEESKRKTKYLMKGRGLDTQNFHQIREKLEQSKKYQERRNFRTATVHFCLHE